MIIEPFDPRRRRAKFIIAAGIFISLVVAGVVFLVIRVASGSALSDTPMRPVVVAVREIPGRTAIVEADVQMRTVAVDPSNATAFSRIDEVLGRIMSVSVSEGQILMPNLLASATANQAYTILDPRETLGPSDPAWRAVSLTVPDAMAVGGTIQPGQSVDVVVTMTINPQIGLPPEVQQPAATPAVFVPGPSTRVTLQNMPVLARNGPVYILRADLDTAEKIGLLIAAGGQFMFVLRPDVDTRTATTDGSTLDTLVDEFGFRVPKRPPLDGEPGMAEPNTGSASPSATAAPTATP